MFDISDNAAKPLTNEEFHARIDQYLGNLAEILGEEEIDPEHFTTPWAQIP